MKKIVFFVALILSINLINSCGDVGDADLGNTVIVTASVDNSYVEQDVVLFQTDANGNCNKILMPAINNINVNVNVSPISQDIQNPSPVSITQIELRYYPVGNAPSINPLVLEETQVVNPGDTGIITIPVISSIDLANVYNTYGTNANYQYRVEANIKMKEIYFDKNLEKQVRFNLVIKNILDTANGECIP